MNHNKVILGLNLGLNNGYDSCCNGKTRFKTIDYAQRTINERNLGKKDVYLCPFCGYYHIGSNNNPTPINELPLLIDYPVIQLLKIKVHDKNKLEEALSRLKYESKKNR